LVKIFLLYIMEKYKFLCAVCVVLVLIVLWLRYKKASTSTLITEEVVDEAIARKLEKQRIPKKDTPKLPFAGCKCYGMIRGKNKPCYAIHPKTKKCARCKTWDEGSGDPMERKCLEFKNEKVARQGCEFDWDLNDYKCIYDPDEKTY
jgi:hypothetical protein